MQSVSSCDIVFHFTAEAVRLRHVFLLDLVIIGELDQSLQFLHGFIRSLRNVHVFHLEAKITFADQPVRALINLLNQSWVNLDTQLLCILVLLVQHSDTLTNGLIVVDMLHTLNKVANVQLFLQFEMQYGRLIQKFDVSIRFVLYDFFIDTVQSRKVVCGHGITQGLLPTFDDLEAVITSAYRSFRDVAVLIFENPRLGRAELTVEFVAVFTVELDISEVEL